MPPLATYVVRGKVGGRLAEERAKTRRGGTLVSNNAVDGMLPDLTGTLWKAAHRKLAPIRRFFQQSILLWPADEHSTLQ